MQQAHAMKRDLIAFITSLGLIVVGIYAIMQSNLKEVNIIDNGELITFTTHGQTVNEVLQEAEVRVGNFDEMNVDFETEVFDGMEIQIERAQQVVINDGGLRSLVMTTESTVDGVLNKRDIDLGSDDELMVSTMAFTVAPTAIIRDGMEIDLTRVEFEFEAEYEEIDLPPRYVETDELLKGEREIRTEGSPRIIQRIIKTTLRNGEVYEEEESETNVVDEGVREVIAIGTREIVSTPVMTLSTGGDFSPISTFTASVTAYVANCVGCTGRVACTGRDVRSNIYYEDGTFGTVRIVAAGTQYPCGTILEIAGIGRAIVLDRGGKVTGNVVDLLVNANNTNPWQFGRRSLQTSVLRMGW